MKILFASGSMLGGGAERVVSVLANELSKVPGVECTVAVVRGDSVYVLSENVGLRRIYTESEITTNVLNKIYRRLVYIPRIFRLVREERPDVVIPVHGGGWNGLFILISRILGTKVIAAEHTSWTVGRHKPGRWFERYCIYRVSSAITVLTEDNRKYYSSFLPHTFKIPNPLSLPILERATQPR